MDEKLDRFLRDVASTVDAAAPYCRHCRQHHPSTEGVRQLVVDRFLDDQNLMRQLLMARHVLTPDVVHAAVSVFETLVHDAIIERREAKKGG